MEKNMNVNTKSLEAVIYPNGNIKLIIYYNIQKSGWVKRELRKSCFGIDSIDFTSEYINKEVAECYKRFPSEEIDELLTKIRKSLRTSNLQDEDMYYNYRNLDYLNGK